MVCADCAIVLFGHDAHECKPQSRAARVGAAMETTGEALEERAATLRLYSRALIDDFHDGCRAFMLADQVDTAVSRRELHGIAQQIYDGARKQLPIAADHAGLVGHSG
jgi:hypothetical protein